MIRKVEIENLKIGKTYLVEHWDCQIHRPYYREVILTDVNGNKIYYQYKNGWKEYVTKSQWTEFGLYEEDGQLSLFEL